MENQKWTVVTSGHNDYVKIVTEIDNITLAYYNVDKKDINRVQKLALSICDTQNKLIKNL
jgi:hypothetical protein